MYRQHAILTLGGEKKKKNSVFRVRAMSSGPQVALQVFYSTLSVSLGAGDMIDLSIMKNQCDRLLGKPSHKLYINEILNELLQDYGQWPEIKCVIPETQWPFMF